MYAKLFSRLILSILLAVGLTGCKDNIEILVDEWGIPHIYANTDEQLLYGLAWSQMRNHGNLILKLYGRSSGNAAKYWGREYLAADRHVWTMGIPDLAAEHYAKLDVRQKRALQAFAMGMNQYVSAHRAEFDTDLLQVLPIRGMDVARHIAYTLYMPGQQFIDGIVQQYLHTNSPSLITTEPTPGASNGWAIGSGRSVSGKPILLSNTHFPWPNFSGFEQFVWHESHLVGSEVDVYGVGLIGVPALTIGFNDKKAWTVTATNPFDKLDTYELSLVPGGYQFDNEIKQFSTQARRLKVRESDGSFSVEKFVTKRSIHGPVVFQSNEKALAIRIPLPNNIAGADLLEMAKATTIEEFLRAMEPQNLPPLNVLYADHDGNILYTIAGVLADRRGITVDSEKIMSGSTSATLWQETLPFNDMPIVINPNTGYLQNSNQPPWSVTLPGVLDPADFPHDWPDAKVTLRAASSIKMITDRTQIGFDDVIVDKFSTHSELAERVLDDLVRFSRASDRPIVQQAATVLANWDRNYNADSMGAILFTFWAMQLSPQILQGEQFPEHLYATPYNKEYPLTTPSGLKDPASSLQALETAANIVSQNFGSLYAPWGALLRFNLSSLDLPGFGAPDSFGVFSANVGIPQNGPLTTVSGDTWVFVVDFSKPNDAKAVMSYSNASQPHSSHTNDQLHLYADKKLRDIHRRKEDIIAHLESREEISLPTLPPAAR